MENLNLTMPVGLTLVSHFTISQVQTWGSSKDQQFMAAARDASNLTNDSAENFEWFNFVIRVAVSISRKKNSKQIPETENPSKLIMNSFAGVLYPADTMDYVRSIQIQADWTDGDEVTEVWVFGKPVMPPWDPREGNNDWGWEKGKGS